MSFKRWQLVFFIKLLQIYRCSDYQQLSSIRVDTVESRHCCVRLRDSCVYRCFQLQRVLKSSCVIAACRHQLSDELTAFKRKMGDVQFKKIDTVTKVVFFLNLGVELKTSLHFYFSVKYIMHVHDVPCLCIRDQPAERFILMQLHCSSSYTHHPCRNNTWAPATEMR